MRNRKTLLVDDPADCDCCGPVTEDLFRPFLDCCDFRVVWIRVELVNRALQTPGCNSTTILIGGRCYSFPGDATPRSQVPNGAVLFDDITVPVACEQCTSPACRANCPIDCCVYDWLPVCFDTVARSQCCQMGQTAQVRYTTRVQNHDLTHDAVFRGAGQAPCPNAVDHPCNGGSVVTIGNAVDSLDQTVFCDATYQFDCVAPPVCIAAVSSYNRHKVSLIIDPSRACPATQSVVDDDTNESFQDCDHACVPYGGNDGPVFPRLEIDGEDHDGRTSCVGNFTRDSFEPDGTISQRVTASWSYQYGCLSGAGHYEVLITYYVCGVEYARRQTIHDRTYEISPGQPCIGTCLPRAPMPPGASRLFGRRGTNPIYRDRGRGRDVLLGAGDFL